MVGRRTKGAVGMSTSPKPRRRAVRLTPQALGALQSALERRWQKDESGIKPTRAARARLLGASVATVEKILSGEGVDRSTLALAFKRVGLDWDDSCCASVHEEPKVPDQPEATPEPACEALAEPPFLAASEAKIERRGWRRGYALGGILVASTAATICWTLVSPRASTPAPSWMVEHNIALDDGMARFHRADYAGARRALARATALARDHDSAAYLSSALRLAGDIEAAEGNLTVARDRYRSALDIRTVIGQEEVRPAIFEALGVVQTRLGDLKGAEKSLMESLSGYRGAKDPVGVALASRDLGTLAVRTDDLDSAERWFQASLDSVGGLGKPDIVADVDGERALLALRRGRAHEARDAFLRCLDYWTAKGHARWVAVCELRLGLAESALGRRATALAMMRRSKAGFEKVGDRAGISDAANRLRVLEARVDNRAL